MDKKLVDKMDKKLVDKMDKKLVDKMDKKLVDKIVKHIRELIEQQYMCNDKTDNLLISMHKDTDYRDHKRHNIFYSIDNKSDSNPKCFYSNIPPDGIRVLVSNDSMTWRVRASCGKLDDRGFLICRSILKKDWEECYEEWFPFSLDSNRKYSQVYDITIDKIFAIDNEE